MPYRIELTLSGLAIAGAVRRDATSAKHLAHRHIRERATTADAWPATQTIDAWSGGNLDVPIAGYVLQLRSI